MPGYGRVYWHLNLKAEEEANESQYIKKMLDQNLLSDSERNLSEVKQFPSFEESLFNEEDEKREDEEFARWMYDLEQLDSSDDNDIDPNSSSPPKMAAKAAEKMSKMLMKMADLQA